MSAPRAHVGAALFHGSAVLGRSLKDRGTPLEKTVATATGMKKIVCTCGFVVKSHDHKEVAYFAVAHVRDKHKQELTVDAANGMMTDD